MFEKLVLLGEHKQCGGAKLVIVLPNELLAGDGVVRTLDAYTERHWDTLLAGDGHGPDMYLFPQHMSAWSQLVARRSGRPEDARLITGKEVAYGGRQYRQGATSEGGLVVMEEAYELYLNETLQGKRVGIQGSGDVGQGLMERAERFGIHVVAMSDKDGLAISERPTGFVYNEDTQDIRFDNKLVRVNDEVSSRARYVPGPAGGRPEGDALFDLANQGEIDLVMLAGPSNAVTPRNCRKLERVDVAEFANCGMTTGVRWQRTHEPGQTASKRQTLDVSGQVVGALGVYGSLGERRNLKTVDISGKAVQVLHRAAEATPLGVFGLHVAPTVLAALAILENNRS